MHVVPATLLVVGVGSWTGRAAWALEVQAAVSHGSDATIQPRRRNESLFQNKQTKKREKKKNWHEEKE